MTEKDGVRSSETSISLTLTLPRGERKQVIGFPLSNCLPVMTMEPCSPIIFPE